MSDITVKIRESIKYLVYLALTVGGIAAVFYSSQAGQDRELGVTRERVVSVETEIKTLKDIQADTKRDISAQRADIAKTREETVKIAAAQDAMSREQKLIGDEQRALGAKMDDLRTILIRMERRDP